MPTTGQMLRYTARVASLSFLVLGAQVAAAQGKPMKLPSMMGDEDRGGGGGGVYRTFTMSLPVVTLAGEHVGRMEFNLDGKGSLAVEASIKNRREEIAKDKQEETGEYRIYEIGRAHV